MTSPNLSKNQLFRQSRFSILLKGHFTKQIQDFSRTRDRRLNATTQPHITRTQPIF